MGQNFFSRTYADARRRFMDAATKAGAELTSYKIDAESDEQLFIDVAVLSGNQDSAIVVSSGVHGVEGFFGSAVQLARLDNVNARTSGRDVRWVFIHGVNPFGFSKLRRFNEHNVDLNRNFLASNDDYAGVPFGYAGLNRFLNPESAPSRFEPFKLKAIWNIWRMGLPALKEAVAGGQYEYPRGLFFGGKEACQSTRIVQQNFESWIGSSENIVHIDFHSGLGEFGKYRLLLIEPPDSEYYSWYADVFGPECIEALTQPEGIAYTASGVLGEWIQTKLSGRNYRFVAAEFGTYDVIRVLGAIRAENRAHFHSSSSSSDYQQAKAELLECFCPKDATWRDQVIESGLRIMDQSIKALSRTNKDA